MDKFYSKNIERFVKDYWKENNIYEEWVLKNLESEKHFKFLEGPPYTTGSPHLGHTWNRILKDIILRYYSKKGYRVWIQAGFDMHGLPIEEKVESKLKITKKDIENKIELKNFIKECKNFAYGSLKEWIDFYINLAHWQDTDNSYMPIQNEYIEKVWECIAKAYENNLLYEAYKPVWWCPRCQTPLSNQEIEMGYSDAMYKKSIDPSIYVKFKLKDNENTYLLVWTTTPWTLTYNLGIMVNPKEKYAIIEVPEVYIKDLEIENDKILKLNLQISNNKKEYWIVAEKFLEKLKEKFKIDYKVLKVVLGKELEGIEYIPIFYEELKEKIDEIKRKNVNAFKVWLSEEYVKVEEGTGLVHSAPGCGFEDYEVGLKYNVEPFNTVDEDGTIKDTGIFSGWKAKVDDFNWIKLLINKRYLVFFEFYEHDYPICWRCRNKVIIRSSPQWFINIKKIKDSLLLDLEDVKFIPDHAKKAFENVIKSAPDWVISRQRYWGIPLPIWKCKNGHIKIPKNIKEIKRDAKKIYIAIKKSEYAKRMLERYFRKDKIFEIPEIKNINELRQIFDKFEDESILLVQKFDEKIIKDAEEEFYVVRSFGKIDYELIRIYNYDLHVPEVDNIIIKCEICGEEMKRVKDVLDVWVDSGSATFATNVFPVDFIVEGLDQFRGWFYSLAVLGKIYYGKIPYKNVYVHGYVLDKEGRKMSKSLGNVVDPKTLMEKYNIDTVRYYLSSITEAYHDLSLNEEDIKVKQNNLNILWNCHNYLIEYCKYYNFNPTLYNPEKLEWEDRYMLHLLEKTKKEIYESLDNFEIWKIGRLCEKVFLELSRFYIKVTRNRIKEDYKTVLWVIYKVLIDLINIFSIVCPHICEAIFLNLKKVFNIEIKSIILENLPNIEEKYIDERIEKEKEIFEKVLEMGLRLRNMININIRRPLKKLEIYSEDIEINNILKKLVNLYKDLLNVKEISFTKSNRKTYIEDNKIFLSYDTTFDEELEEEWIYRELRRNLQEIRKEMGLSKSQKCIFYIKGDEKVEKVILKYKNKLELETDSTIQLSQAFPENIKTKKIEVAGYCVVVYMLV
ncbi:MAG: isoleucine--tRNA ligase [Nanopusillaceae archaeon]